MSFLKLDDWRRSHNARWIDIEQSLTRMIRDDTGGRMDTTRFQRLRAGIIEPRPEEVRALMRLTNSQCVKFT